MKELTLIPCLLVMVSWRPDAGYSYTPPFRYFNNYNRPFSQYGASTFGGTFPNNLQNGQWLYSTGFGGFPFKPPLTGNPGVFSVGVFPYSAIGAALTGNTGAERSNEIGDSQIDVRGRGSRDKSLTGTTNVSGIPPTPAAAPTTQPLPGVKTLSGTFDDYRPIPVVTKTVYFYESPQELEAPISTNVVLPQPRPKINYKIIFIKTPTAPNPTAPVIPPLAQAQEKTLIYVLVKSPEEGPEITVPTVAPTATSKPEVYFIKYKTQKETKTIDGVQPKPVYGPPDHSGSY